MKLTLTGLVAADVALLVALAAGVALLLAGCGGSSGNAAGASGVGASPGSAASASSAKLERYAECMRSHGVPQFPDPVNGRLELQVTKGGPIDPSSPQFQSAQRACQSLAPAGLGSGSSPNPQQQNQLLRFVSCMRSHGVPNFPDPGNGGAFRITGVDPNSPQFQAAIQKCRKLLPGGAP